MTIRSKIIAKTKEHAIGPLSAALMAAIAKLGEEASRAGVCVEMGGLMPGAAGVSICISGGRRTVTDGPFTESKELIGASPSRNAGAKSAGDGTDPAPRKPRHTPNMPGRRTKPKFCLTGHFQR
jgi:hypothetical protein